MITFIFTYLKCNIISDGLTFLALNFTRLYRLSVIRGSLKWLGSPKPHRTKNFDVPIYLEVFCLWELVLFYCLFKIPRTFHFYILLTNHLFHFQFQESSSCSSSDTSTPSSPVHSSMPTELSSSPFSSSSPSVSSSHTTSFVSTTNSSSSSKRRQGAIIESMHHHGKGVYSGTFSGKFRKLHAPSTICIRKF